MKMGQPLPTRPTAKLPSSGVQIPAPPRKPVQTATTTTPARRLWFTFKRPLPNPARFAIMALGIVGLLTILALSLLSISNGLEMRAFEQHLSDKSTGDLDTALVAQSFLSTRNNLSRIDLEVEIIHTLPHSVVFSLLKGDGPGGQPVYRSTLDTASFAANPFLEFQFPPIAASQGVTYTLVLTTAGEPLNRFLGLRYNSFDVLSSGKMYTDQGETRGDLVITTYYRYGLQDALSDAGATLTSGIVPLLSWAFLLVLPGLALLVWLPSSLTTGQRLLAAPGVSLLALPLIFLVTRAISLPMSGGPMWLLLGLCLALVVVAVLRSGRPLKVSAPEAAGIAFWSLLAVVFALTLYARMLPLHDLQAGLGLDAYHHTLIAQMFVQHGGVPANYEPFAPLASFTYHFGFHALAASIAWLTGQTSPTDMLRLMPVAGQVATALPVLTLTLFGWKVFGNRWAGLLAGALAGLVSIFPAYYVNWSRYTQGMGLALLPIAIILFLEVVQRPLRSVPANGDPGASGVITWQATIRQSGPYLLGVIGAAGLFLTHYRIAMVYAAFVALYLAGRLLADLRARVKSRQAVAPVRRTFMLALLTVAALSPWLVNLAQNFRSHLVGRDSAELQQYYDLAPIRSLLTHWSMLLMLVLAIVGLALALQKRLWPVALAGLVWLPLALWSNPYILAWIAPGFRLPYSGYLDVTTVAESAWLPLALLAGYALADGAKLFLALGTAWSSARLRLRLWQMPASALMGITLAAAGIAVALPISTNLDRKDYIASADEQAMVWMRDNLPRNSYVLVNPFAFLWARTTVYGSDAGMWVPLVAGVSASVPPLPAYNERLADPDYINKILNVIQYEPFTCTNLDPQKCQKPNWQALKDAGITDIFVGTRGGALDVPTLLSADQTDLLYHLDGAWVFALK
jgi:hypothetical protein